ncbi:unnamed protein product [Colias eurytheme]|nr:unnamed protein product [Colias eurytheme]
MEYACVNYPTHTLTRRELHMRIQNHSVCGKESSDAPSPIQFGKPCQGRFSRLPTLSDFHTFYSLFCVKHRQITFEIIVKVSGEIE